MKMIKMKNPRIPKNQYFPVEFSFGGKISVCGFVTLRGSLFGISHDGLLLSTFPDGGFLDSEVVLFSFCVFGSVEESADKPPNPFAESDVGDPCVAEPELDEERPEDFDERVVGLSESTFEPSEDNPLKPLPSFFPSISNIHFRQK